MKHLIALLLIYSITSQAQISDTISWDEVRLKSNQNYIIETLAEKNYTLRINEILASNSTGIEDKAGDQDDWFEIYNYGDEPILLDSLYFSDNLKELDKWQFLPDTITWLPAHQYFLFWADKEPCEGKNHTNFKLSSDGEVLSMSNLNLDIIDNLEFDQQVSNISYGRYPDGGDILNIFVTPSPLDTNNISNLVEILPKVSSNIEGGLFTNTQQLTLYTDIKDAIIKYTLDCSTPTINSLDYTVPLNFDTTTIIRAKSFKEGALESPTLTLSFIFTDNNYSNNVISLISEQKNFTGSNGILTNTTSDLEIPAQFEYFEKGESVFSANAGIKLHSPKLIEQYSIRLYARGSYGDDWFEYPFFDDLAPHKFKRLILRNAGNDNVQTMRENSHMRDHIIQRLAQQSNRDASISEIKPVNVYLNGEYYGIYNLRERIDKYYIETHSDEKCFDLLERCFGYPSNKCAIEGNFDRYNTDQEAIDSLDLSDNNNLDSMLHKYNLINYLDYWITEVFVGNYDWLLNNTKMWSSDNTPWRWIYWDTDHGIGLNYKNYGKPEWNTLAWSLGLEERAGGSGQNNILIRNFLENDSIKEAFIKQFTYLLNTNFSPKNTHKLTDSIANIYRDDMAFHFNRWTESYCNIDSWNNSISGIKDYFSQRPDNVRQHLQTQFGLKTPVNLTINIEPAEAGIIKIDSNIINENNFNGIYFPDYDYKINVKSTSCYIFDHWEGINESKPTFNLSLDQDTTITAVFKDTTTQDNKRIPSEIKIYCYAKTLFIEHDNRQLKHLKIFNTKGLTIKNLDLSNHIENNMVISLSDMTNGIYIVSLKTKAKTYNEKIIIH